MSHFTVLVVGESIQEQLQPYHEFESTGTNDEYVKTIDITSQMKEEYEAWKKDEDQTFKEYLEADGHKTVTYGCEPDIEGEHKYRYVLLGEYNEVVSVHERTNPNNKWDWWVVGGRWTGFFDLKDGCEGEVGKPGIFGTPVEDILKADSALKKDIDTEKMEQAAIDKATEKWNDAQKVIDGRELKYTWDQMLKLRDEGEYTIEEARKIYNDQPVVKDFKALNPWKKPEDYMISLEQYTQKAKDSAFSTFAVVKDGKWYEKGDMGWWGIVSNEKEDWQSTFKEIWNSIGDNERVTIVDCHI